MEIIFDPLTLLFVLILIVIGIRVYFFWQERPLKEPRGYEVSDERIAPLTSFRVNQQESIVILTSGVGPEKIGNWACKVAEETIFELYDDKEPLERPIEFVRRAISECHRRIRNNNTSYSGGCSLALLYFVGKELYWGSSGNISIYVYHDIIRRINKGDLYKYRLRDRILSGQVSENRVLSNSLKNELTSFLGFENFRGFEYSEKPLLLTTKDKILLANFEFSEVFSAVEMEKILAQGTSIQKRSDNFLTLTNEKKSEKAAKFLVVR